MSATSSERGPGLLTPAVSVTSELVGALIAHGGYTHPLFHPDRPDVEPPPLPGQGLLLLMGGLVEQSGLLDDALAMVELRRVRFRQMVRAGTDVRVRLEPGESTTTTSGKRLQEFVWTAVDGDGCVLVEAEALMLMGTTTEENR